MERHTPVDWAEVAPGVYQYTAGHAAVRPVYETGGYVATLGDIRPTLEEALLVSWGIAYNEARFKDPRPPFDKKYAALAQEVVDLEADDMVSLINFVAAAQIEAKRRSRNVRSRLA